MSTSTDAILFYGYNLGEEMDVPGGAADTYLSGEHPVQIGYHGSDSYTIPFVCWGESRITAYRGDAEVIRPVALNALIGPGHAVDDAIRAFAKKHGLPGPGEVIDPQWPDAKASDLGWWLVSWWG